MRSLMKVRRLSDILTLILWGDDVYRKLMERARLTVNSDMTDREFRLMMLDNVLNGRLYDVLNIPFYREYGDDGKYICLQDRRPSVQYNICKIVVDDSLSLLFSESHFPNIDVVNAADNDTRGVLQLVAKHYKLNEVFMEAAYRGSVGSVAILQGVIDGELFYQVLESRFLQPTFENDKTRKLLEVTQKYITQGRLLAAIGYEIEEKDYDEKYYFQRVWTKAHEIYYVPWKVDSDNQEEVVPKVDEDRTVSHGLGFVPIVWIRNLPGGDDIDGMCTFDRAIDIMIEADYLLSQSGRGLRYSSDPTLLIKSPSSLAPGEKVIKGPQNALVVPEGGDASLLEIAGNAANAVKEYIRNLREFALEVIHGNRSNTDKLSVAQSGKAMEVMNQNLIWLADRLRTSYGEVGLVSLLNMTLKILAVNPDIEIKGKKLPKVDINADIVLIWQPWYAYTPDDMHKTSMALVALVESGLVSQKTAIRFNAKMFNADSVEDEIQLIKNAAIKDFGPQVELEDGDSTLDESSNEVENA